MEVQRTLACPYIDRPYAPMQEIIIIIIILQNTDHVCKRKELESFQGYLNALLKGRRGNRGNKQTSTNLEFSIYNELFEALVEHEKIAPSHRLTRCFCMSRGVSFKCTGLVVAFRPVDALRCAYPETGISTHEM